MAPGFGMHRDALPSRSRRTAAVIRHVRGRPKTVALVAVVTALALAGAIVTSASAGVGGTVPAGAIRASSFADQSGARVEATVDGGGGQNVGWLGDGDWMRYADVDLGVAGPVTTSLRVAAAYADRSGTVEVRLGSQTGQVVAAVEITATGGWQSWTTRTDTRPSPGGKQDVFLVLRSDRTDDFVNINWFAFEAAGGPTTPPSVTPTPVTSTPSAAPTVTVGPTVTTTSVPPPATGWIPVDQARWNAQLAAFIAMTARPVPADHRNNAEFNATCRYSHSAPDDPIVFPGLKGASHLHSFLGNDATNADTTPESLMTFVASSCKPVEDHSAYWVPTLLEHGQPVEPSEVVVYYGSLLSDKTKTVPMPQGLRMIAGDAKKQEPTPKGAVNQFYCAGAPQDGTERSVDGNWPVCTGGGLHFTLRFPDCWDGKNLDSPNHKGHVAFGVGGGVCPAGFPVQIPALTFSIAYPTAGSRDGFTLASGLPSSMHGDAFFAWQEDAMAHRVKDCVVQITQCDTYGNF